MRNKIAFVTIVVLLSALVTPLYGQVGKISGVVTDAQGNPMKDVQITIEALDIKRTFKLKTNKKGVFVHAGVPYQSTYRVIAQKEGYQNEYVEGVKPAFGGEDKELEFVLKPGESREMAFEMSQEEIARRQKEFEEAQKRAEALAAVREEFNQGLSLFEQGDYEGALLAFQSAADKDQQQPAVWAHLGNTYERLGRYDDGVQAYEKAIALKPDDPAMYQNLGNIMASKGDPEKAREYYEKAAEMSAALDPKAAATTYYNMGVTYINSGKTAEAAEALKKAVQADPNHAEAHYQLGITLLGLNDLQECLTHLKAYMKLAPSGPNFETAKALVEELGK